jgi:hypothetical protein
MDRYKILLDVAKANYNSFKDKPDELSFVTGLIAEGIHRMKPIHTGLISESASLKGVKICKEHYFGRLASAKLIIKKIAERKWSDERLVQLIKSRSRVHYTTSQENMILRNYDHLYWTKAYAAAGIKLVPFVPRNKKYVYNIDGVMYNSIHDAATAHGVSPEISRYRCNTRSKKWTGWKKVNIE